MLYFGGKFIENWCEGTEIRASEEEKSKKSSTTRYEKRFQHLRDVNEQWQRVSGERTALATAHVGDICLRLCKRISLLHSAGEY